MPQGHRGRSVVYTRVLARASLRCARLHATIATEEPGSVTKNSRQVSACGHEGWLVASGAATEYSGGGRFLRLRPGGRLVSASIHPP
jgi:hypothetical protein